MNKILLLLLSSLVKDEENVFENKFSYLQVMFTNTFNSYGTKACIAVFKLA